MKVKTCYICQISKQICEFNKHSKALDGLSTYCKPCHSNYIKRYNAKRRAKDINFKLLYNLRCRLRTAMKLGFKTGKTLTALGCSIPELRLHLEKRFQPGMTWDNYGNKKGQWSIDHISPLSKFDLRVESDLLKASHYTNLQPLWVEDNISKRDS